MVGKGQRGQLFLESLLTEFVRENGLVMTMFEG